MRSATRNKTGKDPDYLNWIRSLGCWICGLLPVTLPIEAAHIGPHGMGQKCPDRETMPLCWWHHREGPDSHHKLGKKFWAHHGLDREKIIAQLNQEYDKQRSASV